MPEPGFEPGSGSPQPPRISKLPHSGFCSIINQSYFKISPKNLYTLTFMVNYMPNGEVLDELNLIPFVGELRAKVLRENGIRDVETLLKYPIEKLAELDGFSMKIAQKIRRYAAEVESLGLVGKEPIKELIIDEYRCPRCNAIVSKAESSCHRCGKVFYPAPANAEDIIAVSYTHLTLPTILLV